MKHVHDGDLTDKVIVITGGTKGVGRELVFGLTNRGARVVFGGRDDAAARIILNKVNIDKDNCTFVQIDLRELSSLEKLFNIAQEKYKKIDGLVVYAGITPFGSLTECSEESFDDVFDVNFKGAFFSCQYAINAMRKNKDDSGERAGGSIVITGSPHAWSGAKDRAAYSCSKGALYSLMGHIAHNYAEEMIRCNYVTLGWTATEGELELRKNKGMNKEQLYEYAVPLIPMKHLSGPTDYTEAYAFLLSDASKYTTGSVFQMTSGLFIS